MSETEYRLAAAIFGALMLVMAGCCYQAQKTVQNYCIATGMVIVSGVFGFWFVFPTIFNWLLNAGTPENIGAIN